MADIMSFFKIFKKKKKNETEPKVVNESLYITKPKQTINSGLRVGETPSFQLKSPQKLNENIFELKTSKSLSTRKQSINEKERRIELVGNYFQSGNNQRTDVIPVRPQRKHSKNSINLIKSIETLKECHKNQTNQRKPNEMSVNSNKINTSLDSIIEMTGNRVLKTDEKLQKTLSNQLKTNEEKNEDLTKNTTNEMQTNLLNSKSNIDFLDSGLNGLNVDQKCENKPKVISGLVPIKDIDLKTAKCVICLLLVSKNINLTICSHIFCPKCLREWLKYSQHCPQCRTFISSFGHSIRTKFNRICIRSEKDYKVMRVSKNEDNFVDSLGAAYLFEAFLSNREIFKYLDSKIANICAKISELESKLSTNGSVQRDVNIRYRITEQNHKLEEIKRKKRESEESFKEICNETNPQMLSFWKQVSALRMNSV